MLLGIVRDLIALAVIEGVLVLDDRVDVARVRRGDHAVVLLEDA